MRWRRSPAVDAATTRIFFTTDIHGSERCFRKFVNAGKFYDASALILGGDITGKSLVPIERTARGWSCTFNEHVYTDVGEAEREELEKSIRDHGAYPVVGERAELLRLEDEEHRDRVFVDAVVKSITGWVQIAEERLADTGIRCFVTPGNDDFWEIDAPLQASDAVEFVEGRYVRLNGSHEMITTGYSNPTPWETPRELSEDGLLARLEGMFAEVTDPENLVLVAHPPPFGSRLDQAPAIDSEFRVQLEAGAPRMAPVGSTAVRSFIEAHQPLLGLHGHVHESQGAELIGRTLCLNPGSDYADGTLLGSLITIAPGRVVSHQFVAG
jgi:Icc-related predicted phosphoesterase